MKKNWFVTISLTSIFSAFLGAYFFYLFNGTQRELTDQIKQKAILAAESEFLLSDRANMIFNSAVPTDFIRAAKLGRQGVVFIESNSVIKGSTYHNRKISHSTGSGVMTSSDGYIVTNYHVIENADEVHVTLNNKKEYEAKVVGFDSQTDLAVLKIEGENFPYLMFGNSDSLQIGEWVMAVGNPFRLQSTVTAGIVSAKARNINILEQRGIESFIQTDAAVNPGNSGGALINTNAEIVGINTAILSSSGGYEGFSFAIPSQLVKKVLRDIKEYGAVQRGWMGVTVYNIDDAKAKQLGLKEVKGIVIDDVTYGGAAKEAGLIPGDVIMAVNNIEIKSTPQFTELIGQYRPGDKLTITYFRDDHKENAEVILRNQLNTTDYIAVRRDKILADIGIELRDLDTNEINRNKTRGVRVVTVYNQSIADKANIEPGYIITSVNSKKIKNVNEFIQYLQSYHGVVVLNGFYENYPGEFPYTFKI